MRRIILSLITLAASAAAFAQTPLPNDPEVRVGKLENGLTYYIRHNDKPAQVADYYLVSDVGAIQEGPGQDGLAHFLEHMCFNGLKNLPGKQMLEYLQSIGASFGGNINASTGVEVTQYMLNNIPTIRESIIDTCLLVMHDYSHFVTLDPVEIDNERGVILEEKRTRNNAQWRMFEACMPYLYGDTKYARTNIIGSEETLKTFQQPTLVDFYQTWYRPDNQAVIVVGDIDVDQIEAKITRLFADIPAPVDPRPKDVIMLPENAEPIVGVITDPELESNEFEFFWKRNAIPEAYNNTDQVFAINLALDLFELVMEERFSDITSKPGAPFLGAALGSGKLTETCEAMMGQVAFKNGQDMEALEAFLTEVERARRYGVTAAELQRAKDNLLSSYEKAAQGAESRKNSEFIRPLINAFTNNTPFMDPAVRHDLAKAFCAQFPAEAINQIVAQFITDENMVVLLEGSSLAEHPGEQEILDLILASRKTEVEAPVEEESNTALLDAARLKGSPVKKIGTTVAGATQWTLKNGVRVVLLPTEYKKGEISIKLELQGGESLIPDEELYTFERNIWSTYLSNTGLAQFSSSELSKALAGKNVSAEPWIGSTSHGINVSSTPKDLETALQLMYLWFTAPRFDADEYQIGIDQLSAILPNLMTNPMFRFQERMLGALYEGSPRSLYISEEVLAKAKLSDLEKNYRKLFRDAAGAVIYVVGDFDEASIKPLVEKYAGALPKGKSPLSWKDDGERIRSGRYLDHFTIQMTTPKVTVMQFYSAYLPATMENKILLSALRYIMGMVYTDTLREEEGGTYGAQVGCDIVDRPYEMALFQVFFDTNVDQAKALEALAVKGLKELAENGPSDEYFSRTLEYFRNSLPQQRISNSYWMNVLNTWYDFGYDSDLQREEAINALTKEKIADFAKNLIDAGNFIEMEMSPAE